MYFASDEHRLHYMQLIRNTGYDEDELQQPEYRSFLYILSYPILWNLWVSEHRQSGRPHQWFIEELEDLPLSTSEQCLVEVGISLFNGSSCAFGKGVVKWGDEVYRVFQQAVELRRGSVELQ